MTDLEPLEWAERARGFADGEAQATVARERSLLSRFAVSRPTQATEVDDLNGEIVRLAAGAGTGAPLSAAIVALVHDAERAAAGSPQMTPADLWLRLIA